jgi:hypothetical protein
VVGMMRAQLAASPPSPVSSVQFDSLLEQSVVVRVLSWLRSGTYREQQRPTM